MRTVSDAAAFPRADRTWPTGAFGLAVAGGLGALAGSAALVAAARSVHQAVGLVLVFLVVASGEALAHVATLTPWVERRSVPPRAQVAQVGLLALVLVAFVGGPRVGGDALCGFLAGVFLPSASVIRFARVRRSLEEEGTPDLPQGGPAAQAPGLSREERPVRARATPKVGPVLRETLAADRGSTLAWAGATLTAALGFVAAGSPTPARLAVVLLGLTAVTWAGRRTLGTRVALRDFEEAPAAPMRGHVVLMRDPNPRVNRRLLGVWKEEPVPVRGRLPHADAVYRCHSGRDTLASSPGSVIVHEAWLDAGPRALSRPRWVAADAGIALPRRRALLGRRSLDSLIGAERPARTRPLTMAAPDPTTESETGTVTTVINEPTPATGPWLRLFAWRLAVLVILGVTFALLG